MSVGTGPAARAVRIGAEDVVIGQQVGKTQAFGSLSVVAYSSRVAADLSLGENNTNSHGNYFEWDNYNRK